MLEGKKIKMVAPWCTKQFLSLKKDVNNNYKCAGSSIRSHLPWQALTTNGKVPVTLL
jgi:hypothetical protein